VLQKPPPAAGQEQTIHCEKPVDGAGAAAPPPKYYRPDSERGIMMCSIVCPHIPYVYDYSVTLCCVASTLLSELSTLGLDGE
jgi:hypothetical protein